MNSSKKTYVQPSVEVLGTIAEKTQSGGLPNTDTAEFPNTALPLPPSS